MKRLPLPSLVAAAALFAARAHGETPAPGAAPATPAAPPAATTPAAPGATAPAAGAKAKPYSTNDLGKIKDFMEALRFNFVFGQAGRYKKDDKELSDLGTRVNKEAADYITPLTNIAQAHGVDIKYLPQEVTASQKSAIEKVNKSKPDKLKQEYYELLVKETKRGARSIDAAAKAFTDPELKELATKAAKTFDEDADSFEKTLKDLKSPKKETKK
jgi:hypothetical protein